MSREAQVRSLLAALEGGPDAHDDVLAHFSPDATYAVNAWQTPKRGHDEIRAELERQSAEFSGLQSEIVRLVESSEVVMVERHDSMTIAGKQLTLHFAGLFVFGADGLIAEWSDWYDSAEIVAAMSA
ncbi:MAG: putative Limonene,2-epoxide hydrolase [Aeromicrobium sp.]|nr:putative Limonene,2-epoxide hydrolase [Aeromicrobium sp.]